MAGQEGAPRPDGGAAENERRQVLVTAFRGNITRAVESIRSRPHIDSVSVELGDFRLRYALPQYKTPTEAVTITNLPNYLTSSFDKPGTKFVPHEDKEGRIGIRMGMMSNGQEIGSKHLSLEEIEALVKVTENPIMNALLIRDLVKPTDVEAARHQAKRIIASKKPLRR